MPPAKKTPQPIDRPLSKAYLRGFTGWSTAYPPGASDPASLRIMDNVWVDRNGSVCTRPGLRYFSYQLGPDSPILPGSFGIGLQDLELVGEMELFYTADGSRALLFAVREADGTVSFRALLMSGSLKSVYALTDAEIDFAIPQGEPALRFSKDTKYVRYLQLNNKILALSDNGEAARYFDVGTKKVAKVLTTISVPEWTESHKLTVLHPDADWINDHNGYYEVFNGIENPTFDGGYYFWNCSDNCEMKIVNGEMRIGSKPERTNHIPNPLHDVDTSLASWGGHPEWPATVSVGTFSFMHAAAPAAGRYYGAADKMAMSLTTVPWFKVAFDYNTTNCAEPELLVEFYTVDNARLAAPLRVPIPANDAGRFVSDEIQTPDGAVTVRVSFGGTAAAAGEYIAVQNVVVCDADEATDAFSGDTPAADYYWTGTPYASSSVYHPPATVTLQSDHISVTINQQLHVGAQVRSAATGTHSVTLGSLAINAGGGSSLDSTSQNFTAGQDSAISRTRATVPVGFNQADFVISVSSLPRGEYFYIDDTYLTSTTLADQGYFSGATPDTATVLYSWEDDLRPHASRSRRAYLYTGTPSLVSEAKTANTLIKAGGSAANPYKMAFFYTFENETGESAPSQITEVRMQRPWSNWYWEEPNGAGEPSGTATTDPYLACDQLVAGIPQAVYDQAVAEGALKWNLYAMSWSDQDPVPVEADLVGTRIIRASPSDDAAPYSSGHIFTVTPRKLVTSYALNLPTKENRVNYSVAPRHRNGLVAGERLILVGDPANPAGIQWTSNLPAESLNFTPLKGGGVKTLTTGNLNIPVDVALWQNPQSVDTITILCNGDDGESVAYYMAPASVNQNSSGTATIMGFEQVTNTPGTEAVYGSEVMNNALYRPVDYGLIKSTANNYSLKHKTVTDDIANMWHDLRTKSLIVTAQLENRLYMLVNNAQGELMEQGCRGNEIWVHDIASEKGTWSKFNIQAHSLKVFTVGNRARLGVLRPDGVFYLDPYYRKDDWVDPDNSFVVTQRPIEWYFETNTQGANRAHDAWCRLQQVSPTLGNFSGKMQYGIRGHTVDGKRIEPVKQFEDQLPYDHAKAKWDVQDMLQVRRDLMEWFFWASSVPGEYGTGEISAVQYRYVPVTVNVGYEYGSVETFEYGRNVTAGPDRYSANGIPTDNVDFTRP